ncbi:hypothetical protein RIF29_33105 [Crotalaria pallida]|uniref:FAR1 domain-containing protein n=2 Tax=Crotalaria pallida TaxID=3830 RepID=A0AAN9HST2_CROPI
MVNRKRAPRGGTRCYCKAEMRIYLQSTTGRWIVCYFNDQHNHQLLPGFGRIHRSQSKITEPDMEEVRSLRRVGIKMPHIYASFAERVGGYPYVGFKKKALYNRLHGENKDGVGHAALKYMWKSVSTDPGFVWKHVVDSDGHLLHLFWCSGYLTSFSVITILLIQCFISRQFLLNPLNPLRKRRIKDLIPA